MKSKELTGLPMDELQEKLDTAYKSIYTMRVQSTLKELKTTSDIRATRRDIARLKQVISAKQRETASATKS